MVEHVRVTGSTNMHLCAKSMLPKLVEFAKLN